jgi:hypothetical protein
LKLQLSGLVGVVALLLSIAAQQGFSQQTAPSTPPSPAEVAAQLLDRAIELYASGEYVACRHTVSTTIAEYLAGGSGYPMVTMARFYGLDALLAYTFREEGYEAKVDEDLQKGLELDLNLDLGDPASVPPFVLDRFSKVKNDYLAQFQRTTRRSAIGIFGALVLDPMVLQNISLLQPGIAYSFNVTDTLTVDAEIRIPLQWPIWNSIRGQIGLIWYPSFAIESIATGVSFSYVLGIDNLSSATHSLSLGGRAEFLTRWGLGIIANAELARIDLIFGAGTPSQPPTYQTIPGGLIRIVFANVTVYVIYAF